MAYSNYSSIDFKFEQGKEIYEQIKGMGGTLFASYNQGLNEIYFLPQVNSVVRVDAKINNKGIFDKIGINVMSEKKEDLLKLIRDFEKTRVNNDW